MRRTRTDRKRDFEYFFNNAVETFTSFRDNDSSAEKFERIYMLNICPGSRNGGRDTRVVEVFWGSAPFEQITEGRNWRTLSEYGATLLFSLDDNGFVYISIYPAGTENRHPVEMCITLNIWLDPKKLKDKNFLRKCWNRFMAYMEYTCLEGNPTFSQKIRVWYLRNFKRLVIEKKSLPTKASVFFKDVLKFSFSVGMSGFLLYFITQPFSKTDNNIENRLDTLNSHVKNISDKMDTILQKK